MTTIIDQLRAYVADLVDAKGKTMERWDEIRRQVERHKGSDLPRLNFESLMEDVAEKFELAIDEIERLTILHHDAESSLVVWDDNNQSVYWSQHPERAGDH